MERYQPSGRFGAPFLPVLLACVALAAGLAWVYQKLIDLIPFIYVNVLLTFGFGLVLAALLAGVLHVGRNRSRMVAWGAALVLALAADAASFWWAYRFDLPDIHEALSDQAKSEGTTLVPEEEFAEVFTFEDWVALRVEAGWSVGRITSSSSSPLLSGLFVYAIWLIEAGILVWMCVMGARRQADEPFCESCGVWYVPEPFGTWPKVDTQPLRRAVRDEELAPLLAPVPAAASEDDGAFVLHGCPSCQQNPYLDVALTRLEKDKDGKVETKTELLAGGVALTVAQRDALRKYAYPAAPRSKGGPGPRSTPAS